MPVSVFITLFSSRLHEKVDEQGTCDLSFFYNKAKVQILHLCFKKYNDGVQLPRLISCDDIFVLLHNCNGTSTVVVLGVIQLILRDLGKPNP